MSAIARQRYTSADAKRDFERRTIERFITHLRECRQVDYVVCGRDVVVDAATGRNYDFELSSGSSAQSPLAVDIFQLVDSENEAQSDSRRNRVWGELKEELGRLGVTDTVVTTPYDISVLGRDAKTYARAIAEQIATKLSKAPQGTKLSIPGYHVKRIPGLNTAALMAHSQAAWVNGAETAKPQLTKNLDKKDLQLAVRDHERIVVAVNAALKVDAPDAISALATSDTSNLQNIDRVYLETERGGFRLIYDRRVRDAFSNGDIPLDKEAASLFDEWLLAKLDERVPGVVARVRQIADKKGSLSWVGSPHTRVALIHRVRSAVERGEIEMGVWLARLLVNDPDPPLSKYENDERRSLHERVLHGEDVSCVSTVRGDLCWLLYSLLLQARCCAYDEISALVERLLNDKNAYVRMQACQPLSQLAALRRRRTSAGYLMSEPLRNCVRELAFEVLRKNRRWPQVLQWLPLVFQYIADLNEDELNEVLDTLCPGVTRDGMPFLARVIVYFGALRSSDEALKVTFDATAAGRRLKSLIETRGTLRQEIAYAMSDAVEKDPRLAVRLREFALLLPNAGAEGSVLYCFYKIVDQLLSAGDLDEDLKSAVIASAHAALSSGPELLVSIHEAMPVLRELAARSAWETVVEFVETVSPVMQTARVQYAELVDLIATAPPKFGDRVGRIAPTFC